MERRQIANIIFFVRAVEPRDLKRESVMVETVRNQIDLVRRYGFPASFLLQYDALIRPDYMELVKNLPENCEVGGWFEIVQPLAEKAGLLWRGRTGFAWDWHPNVGFSVGYTPKERRKLADVFVEDFRERFGFTPRSVGSWLIDAGTLAYLSDRYGLEASCNCRDQWGTDGYTLWGGYWGQGYYPSRLNALCPAQTEKQQIHVPTFRMLGSDPIYQYDDGLFGSEGLSAAEAQHVVTLEPVYPESGGNSKWIDWYFQENFKDSVTFGYTQIGQENNFGWESMKKGLLFQFEELNKLCDAGKISVLTLCETGKWYKNTFPLTAVTSASAMTDWQAQGRKSVWFESRFYRVNLYEDNGCFWARDIHKFDENYKERYISAVCEGSSMIYDNLPVMDGNRWSAGKIRAGLYPKIRTDSGKTREIKGTLEAEYPDTQSALIKAGVLNITCLPERIVFTARLAAGETLLLELCDGVGTLKNVKINGETLQYEHNGYQYTVKTTGAEQIFQTGQGIAILAQGETIDLIFQ